MKKLILIMTVLVMVFGLSACETMKGLGKDVEGAGSWVQKKAG